MNEEFTSADTDRRGRNDPFSLELVAHTAVHVLLANKSSKNQPPYEDAVDVAMRLLQACRSRLEDESAREKDRPVGDWNDPLHQSRREQTRLEQKYGNPVPFLKGLLYITHQKSQGEALPHYMRWLLYHIGSVYAEAESRQFFGQPEPPRPTQENLELELKRQRREGFHPVTLMYYREDYAKWHIAINLPERKRRPKSKKPG